MFYICPHSHFLHVNAFQCDRRKKFVQHQHLYFPAGSVHTSYHTPQHWEETERTFVLVNIEIILNFYDDKLFRYLLSRSVFLRSILKLFSAGASVRLRSVSTRMLRVKAGLSPRMLCPFSLSSWTHSIDRWLNSALCDHTHFSPTGPELAAFFFFFFSLAKHRCWICVYQLIQATGNPNGRNVCSPGFLLHHSGPFSSTAPVHPDVFVLFCSPLPQR